MKSRIARTMIVGMLALGPLACSAGEGPEAETAESAMQCSGECVYESPSRQRTFLTNYCGYFAQLQGVQCAVDPNLNGLTLTLDVVATPAAGEPSIPSTVFLRQDVLAKTITRLRQMGFTAVPAMPSKGPPRDPFHGRVQSLAASGGGAAFTKLILDLSKGVLDNPVPIGPEGTSGYTVDESLSAQELRNRIAVIDERIAVTERVKTAFDWSDKGITLAMAFLVLPTGGASAWLGAAVLAGWSLPKALLDAELDKKLQVLQAQKVALQTVLSRKGGGAAGHPDDVIDGPGSGGGGTPGSGWTPVPGDRPESACADEIWSCEVTPLGEIKPETCVLLCKRR